MNLFFKDRFQRCVLSCGDKIKDKYPLDQSPNPNQREDMQKCLTICGDEMIKIIPTFTKKIQDWFKNETYLK